MVLLPYVDIDHGIYAKRRIMKSTTQYNFRQLLHKELKIQCNIEQNRTICIKHKR